jgi:DNA-binding MarR family transcriptional regulator
MTENVFGAVALEVSDRMARRVAEAAGLGANGPAALVLLDQAGQLSIRPLAELLRITHPATVQLVDRLVAQGLVDRRPGADARVRMVTLTATGRRVTAEVLSQRAQVLREVLAPLDTSEREALQRVLDRVLTAMSDTPYNVDHTCRLCDVTVCTDDICPAEIAVAPLR